MGRAKNTIKLSDISSAPINVQYSASYTSESLQDYGITTNRGINVPLSTSGSYPDTGIKYRLVKQLYYQNYLTGSLIGSSSAWDPNLQSTAASGTFDDDYRYFPKEIGDQVCYLAIPADQFGDQIKRKTFEIKSTQGLYHLVDDGNGNLIDLLDNNVHVGNILYAQGIAVITNLDYCCIVLNNRFAVSVTILP